MKKRAPKSAKPIVWRPKNKPVPELDALFGPEAHDGVIQEVACDCGRRNFVVIEWSELFCIRSNRNTLRMLLPESWDFDEASETFYPTNLACPQCGRRIVVLITRNDANIRVRRAIDSGWISAKDVRRWNRELPASHRSKRKKLTGRKSRKARAK